VKSFHVDDVVGKNVIETTGMVLGRVKDVVFDVSSTVTLIVVDSEGRERQIPLSKVTGIADNIVARSDMTSGLNVSASGLECQFCGGVLMEGQRICPACGRAQV